MDGKMLYWWQMLSEDEQNILITLLYKLDLQDYVEMDKDGKIIKLLN
uniref:Uncharacterized protein n=1 Tax=viral metagenome TaxID=1070528 RepID=A0A6M3JHU1_9ZZZZ